MKVERAYILDYDGTICDSAQAIAYSLEQVLVRHGDMKPNKRSIEELIGSGCTLQATLQSLQAPGTQLSTDELNEMVGEYRRIYAREGEPKVRLFPSAVDVLTQLGKKGNLVLLSNKGIDAVTDSLKKFSIFEAFDLVLAEEPGCPRKPEAAVFEARIQPTYPALTPNRCLVVGDTQTDLRFGINIGAATAFAAYGYGDKDKCMAMTPTHVLATFAEVLACT